MSSAAPSWWSSGGKPSVWVYRNSTAAGAAGGALGARWFPGFTGGMAATGDMRLLLRRRSLVVVPDRAAATVLDEPHIAAGVEQVHVERLVRLLPVVAVDHDRDRPGRLAGGEGQGAG